ncbi:hypothetical protein Cgig2_033830 [Carnegiea gigantea]|uniref:Uncharacterized protein n=1 Tax=Carnegiea gigantea TaxID=171969 RepID=A0A9Q1JTF2_9CARY|nr:hypothetical protein Cgig2_033830 [Carnegiea gigantea]
MTNSTPPNGQQAEDTAISLTEAVIEAPSDTTVTPETPILQNAQVSPRSTYASVIDLDEDVNLEGPFPDFVEFFNENGVLIIQQVIFEWLPTKWRHCLMYGHEEVNYRKKEKGRKEKRPISQKGNTIRSRIDRAFCNAHWWETFDYTHNKYLPNALSDHTPQFLHFPTSTKPKPSFQYCDMWSRHENFWPTIKSVAPIAGTSPSLQQIISLLGQMRAKLRLFNRDHFADLRSQQGKARITMETVQQALQIDPRNEHLLHKEKEARDKYIAILSSSLSLMQQQSKMEWITQGDLSTRFFFAKAKQRKLSTYIYAIKDDHGKQVEGFEEVGAIMMNFYKGLLGEHPTCRSSLKQEDLGAPITASKLTKLECRSLLEKITARVKIWASRNLSFAGRAVLINNVIDNLSKICRNYLWGGSTDSRRIPHVAWHPPQNPRWTGVERL